MAFWVREDLLLVVVLEHGHDALVERARASISVRPSFAAVRLGDFTPRSTTVGRAVGLVELAGDAALLAAWTETVSRCCVDASASACSSSSIALARSVWA